MATTDYDLSLTDIAMRRPNDHCIRPCQMFCKFPYLQEDYKLYIVEKVWKPLEGFYIIVTYRVGNTGSQKSHLLTYEGVILSCFRKQESLEYTSDLPLHIFFLLFIQPSISNKLTPTL